MTAKKRLATVWLGGCSGCHMSFLDLDDTLVELAAKIDLVYGPLVDTKEYPAQVDFCLIEGAVTNQENLKLTDLAKAGVYQFAYVYTPTPIKGATGSMGSPVVIW